MATWGKCDFRQLKKLQADIQRLEKVSFEKFCQDVAKELAARLLAKVIKRTPRGKYKKGSGMIGGTLIRGWTAKTEDEAKAGGTPGVKEYVEALTITKTGNVYQIEIINPVEYAPYVEFGHRTRDHKKWVEGRFMLTISEGELDRQAPGIVEKKLLKYLGEVMG